MRFVFAVIRSSASSVLAIGIGCSARGVFSRQAELFIPDRKADDLSVHALAGPEDVRLTD